MQEKTADTTLILKDVCKNFGAAPALQNINIQLQQGSICAIIGTNGAGKSTLLRIISGIYPPSPGFISVCGNDYPHNNPTARQNIAFVPDEPYFLPKSNMRKMAEFYCETIDVNRLAQLCNKLGLDENKKLFQFSGGQQKLAAMLLALCRRPKLLLLDESLDSLDLVIRAAVKRILIDEVQAQGTSIIISSHSLREVEDFCDTLIILHKGEVLEQADMHTLGETMFKGQLAPLETQDIDELAANCGFKILSRKQNGSLLSFTASGNLHQSQQKLQTRSLSLLQLQPMSPEEIFTQLVSQKGYTFSDVLGGQE